MPARKLLPVTAAGPRDVAGHPLTQVPAPPAWMNHVAASAFTSTMEYLVDLRAVTAGEVPLVEQYAACYGRWVEAETALATGDPGWRTVTTRQGTAGSAVPSSMMLQSRNSVEQLRKLAAALGLTPTDRSKLPASRAGGEEDPMERLLVEAGL